MQKQIRISKKCCTCKNIKSIKSFYKNKSSYDGFSSVCINCVKEYLKIYRVTHKPSKNYHSKYYIKNKEKIQKNHKLYRQKNKDKISIMVKKWYLKQYNLSLEDYILLLKEQNNVCAICKQKETKMSINKRYCLAVDHDHKTGKVRGLLCSRCNRGVGLFLDNINYFQNAVNYLRKKK